MSTVSCDAGTAAGEIGLLAIDYVEFQKCTMGGSAISWVLLLVLLGCLFWLLGDTADTYFSPILGQVCETVSKLLLSLKPLASSQAQPLSSTRALPNPLRPRRTSSTSRTALPVLPSSHSAMAPPTCSLP